jgi:hypothetical protein
MATFNSSQRSSHIYNPQLWTPPITQVFSLYSRCRPSCFFIINKKENGSKKEKFKKIKVVFLHLTGYGPIKLIDDSNTRLNKRTYPVYEGRLRLGTSLKKPFYRGIQSRVLIYNMFVKYYWIMVFKNNLFYRTTRLFEIDLTSLWQYLYEPDSRPFFDTNFSFYCGSCFSSSL